MLSIESIAQFNYDFHWYNGNGHFLYGPPRTDVNLMNFKNFDLTILHDTAALGFNGQNITFSDREGNLLFYSNGCELRDKDHQLIKGSDPLLPGSDDEEYCSPPGAPDAAMTGPQSMLVIPFEINKDSTFYYIYQIRDTVRKIGEFVDRLSQFREHLLLETTDSLQLIYKDSTVSEKYAYSGFVNAIRHSNNKDWWLTYPLYKDSEEHEFESVLITKKGATGVKNNVHSDYPVPISIRGRSSGQIAVSPNGNKLALFRRDTELMTFSFNRRTGKVELTNRDTMPWVIDKPLVMPRGTCYSPDGRFLYVSIDTLVYQLDTESPAFPFDTVQVASSSNTNFSLMQMGPDCKIYIFILPGGDAYHVIHRPNEKGKECMLEIKGAELPTDYRLTIPLFPNYRLGTTEENWCDSIFDDTTSSSFQFWEKQKHWQIWPNPTDGYLRIGYVDGNFGLESIDVYTFQGQKIQQQSFDALNVTYEMDISHLPEGIYLVKIKPRIGREEWHRVVVQ